MRAQPGAGSPTGATRHTEIACPSVTRLMPGTMSSVATRSPTARAGVRPAGVAFAPPSDRTCTAPMPRSASCSGTPSVVPETSAATAVSSVLRRARRPPRRDRPQSRPAVAETSASCEPSARRRVYCTVPSTSPANPTSSTRACRGGACICCPTAGTTGSVVTCSMPLRPAPATLPELASHAATCTAGSRRATTTSPTTATLRAEPRKPGSEDPLPASARTPPRAAAPRPRSTSDSPGPDHLPSSWASTATARPAAATSQPTSDVAATCCAESAARLRPIPAGPRRGRPWPAREPAHRGPTGRLPRSRGRRPAGAAAGHVEPGGWDSRQAEQQLQSRDRARDRARVHARVHARTVPESMPGAGTPEPASGSAVRSLLLPSRSAVHHSGAPTTSAGTTASAR